MTENPVNIEYLYNKDTTMNLSPYMLMLIGLSTVFCILLLVIVFGNMLIWCVNKFLPEEPKPLKNPTAANAVDPNVRQAIELAVCQLTGGKKSVESIQKL